MGFVPAVVHVEYTGAQNMSVIGVGVQALVLSRGALLVSVIVVEVLVGVTETGMVMVVARV